MNHFIKQTPDVLSRQVVRSLVIFCAALLLSTPSLAEETNSVPGIDRTVANYVLPDLTVVREDGQKLPFIQELDDGRPVIMNFIFASCSAICPMLTHVFAKVQSKLDKDNQAFHLVSISIDPENDTPSKLSEYAKKFNAGKNWNYYTGSVDTSVAIQKAFNAYRGDKMNHSSVIFLRAAPGKSWTRLDGFVSPDAVVREYHALLEQKI